MQPGTARNQVPAGSDDGERHVLRPVRSEETLTPFLRGLRRNVGVAQCAAIAMLGVCHAVFTWPVPGVFPRTLFRMFHLDREMNLPTWFASLQFTLLGLTLLALATASARLKDGWWRTGVWGLGATAALYLSADETARIHERLGTAVSHLLRGGGGSEPTGFARAFLDFPSYYWILLYAPLALPVALIFGIFVWRELGPFRRSVVAGIVVFLVAAVGLDYAEGRWGNDEHDPVLVEVFSRDLRFDIFMLEELLEMTGLMLALHGFLGHGCRLARRLAGVDRGNGPDVSLPAPTGSAEPYF